MVGQQRLPTIDDEHKLPYCRSLIKEVSHIFFKLHKLCLTFGIARKMQPSAVQSSHLVNEDFEYRGMLIPKGSSMVLNSFSINNDFKLILKHSSLM